MALAFLALSSDMAKGRPPRRPLALAASNPARVRSCSRARSYSAKAANTWNTRAPFAVVVSMSGSSQKTENKAR